MKDMSSFLVALIDRLTPLNNGWRMEKNALSKIELMWEIGREIDIALKSSDFGFDELLRTLYDPHGNKMTYITRDLGSYSHRVYLYFKSKEDIRIQLKGLTSYTLFREAFPLITNEKYKVNDEQKSEILKMIIYFSSAKTVQNKLKNMKQSIIPIKNTRTTKAQQYADEAKWLLNLQEKIKSYFIQNEVFNKDLFPIKEAMIEDLKNILLALVSDKKMDKQLNLNKPQDEMLNKLTKIANSKTEDKARFKKWGLDTHGLMIFAEMLNAVGCKEKYNFVRRKHK